MWFLASKSNKHVTVSTACLAVVTAMLLTLTGCTPEEGSVTTSVETTRTATGLKPLTQEFVYEMAVKRINDPGLVRSASIASEGDKKVIVFQLSRPALCHDGAVVGTTATFAQKTMSALFKYPEVARVEVTMFGTTSESPANNEVAVKIVVDRAAADRIDWFAFNDVTMPTLASSYFVDPRIQANWVVEGGETTPRSQQSATTTTPNR